MARDVDFVDRCMLLIAKGLHVGPAASTDSIGAFSELVLYCHDALMESTGVENYSAEARDRFDLTFRSSVSGRFRVLCELLGQLK